MANLQSNRNRNIKYCNIRNLRVNTLQKINTCTGTSTNTYMHNAYTQTHLLIFSFPYIRTATDIPTYIDTLTSIAGQPHVAYTVFAASQLHFLYPL